jgi:hypothetical protein
MPAKPAERARDDRGGALLVSAPRREEAGEDARATVGSETREAEHQKNRERRLDWGRFVAITGVGDYERAVPLAVLGLDNRTGLLFELPC